MTTATELLTDAADAIADRARYRDENYKSSVAKAVEIFNVITNRDMTEREGNLFMLCIKIGRSQQGEFHVDDYTDAAAYAAMAGESHARQVRPARQVPEVQEDSEVGRLECGADSWGWADQVAWGPSSYETKMVGVS